jgi:fumarate reductase (CoM/CoB) subunit A
MPAEVYSKIIKDGVPAYKQYRNLGVDITKGPFEAAPSFHFQIGGVWINERGESTIPGLFAAGEVSGNVHGANRLAGDAVPELLVFGTRAGQNAAKRSLEEKGPEPERQQIDQEVEKIEKLFQIKKDSIRAHEIRDCLAGTMYAHVGLSRTAQGIAKAMEEIERLATALGRIRVCDSKIFNLGLVEAKEVELMIDTARAIATSALIRQESRGAHFREDYPITDFKNWTKHVVLGREDDKLRSTVEPVVFTKLKPPERN